MRRTSAKNQHLMRCRTPSRSHQSGRLPEYWPTRIVHLGSRILPRLLRNKLNPLDVPQEAAVRHSTQWVRCSTIPSPTAARKCPLEDSDEACIPGYRNGLATLVSALLSPCNCLISSMQKERSIGNNSSKLRPCDAGGDGFKILQRNMRV